MFTFLRANPALLILIPSSVSAAALFASKPGWSILVPSRQTMATFSTVTFSKSSSSLLMSFLLKSRAQITIEMLLALVDLKV
ncbi:hypothetical protein D3C71_1906460 [compost metagenome]